MLDAQLGTLIPCNLVAPTLTVFASLKTHDILFVNPTASVPGTSNAIRQQHLIDIRHRPEFYFYIRALNYLLLIRVATRTRGTNILPIFPYLKFKID